MEFPDNSVNAEVAARVLEELSRRLARKWRLTDEVRDEVRQMVYLKVAAKPNGFVPQGDPVEAYRKWLCAVFFHAMCDYFRKSRRQPQQPADSAVLDGAQSGHSSTVRRQIDRITLLDRIDAALTPPRVKPFHFEVWRMHSRQDMSAETIAQATGNKTTRVLKILNRLKLTIRNNPELMRLARDTETGLGI